MCLRECLVLTQSGQLERYDISSISLYRSMPHEKGSRSTLCRLLANACSSADPNVAKEL